MATERYTHGHHESVLRSHRWRTAENSAAFVLSHLGPGTALLDVGCGPGNITADLAARIEGGSTLGIDLSDEVVRLARESHRGVANLEFAVGDVYALDAPDESYDLVFAHQVLQHLSDPVRAFGELRRVLRPGGLLAARDADFGAFAWAPADVTLDRWMSLYHDVTRRNGAEADGGRHLKAWARAAGFEEPAVTASNWVFATDDERRFWGGLWADRVEQSDFARQSVEYELSTREELATIAAAFRRWAESPDGVFIVPNVEILARK